MIDKEIDNNLKAVWLALCLNRFVIVKALALETFPGNCESVKTSQTYVDSSTRHAVLLLRHLVPVLVLLLAGRHGAGHDGVPGAQVRRQPRLLPRPRLRRADGQ